jgi:uncharacterized protein (DUF697 family)
VSRKTLPKAIQPATRDAGPVFPDPATPEVHQDDLTTKPGFGAQAVNEALARGDNAFGSAPEPVPKPEAKAAAPAAAASPGSADAEDDATRRRALAKAIVERHAAYAAVGGIIPVPIANVAGVTAVIVRMVKVLSGLYGVPFERDRARAIVIGLMGGTVPTGFAAVTTSTLVSLVPVSNLIGLAVSSVTAIACTRSIGHIFVEHFEGGATLQELPAAKKT